MQSILAGRTCRTDGAKVSPYDRVSAALWALILVFGVLAAIVVMMWLQLVRHGVADSPQPGDQKQRNNNIVVLEPFSGNGEDGGDIEFSDTDVRELVDFEQALTDLPTRFWSLLLRIEGRDLGPGHTKWRKGPQGDDPDPPGGVCANHWSIEYESENYQHYLDQLARFGIEIGFVSKQLDSVEIVYDIGPRPKIRPTTKAEERRVYFIHVNGKLQSWDRRLAQTAGIKPGGKMMVQFYPAETTATLAQLEAAEVQRLGMEIRQIQRTTFKVRQTAGRYEYYVAEVLPK